MDELLFFTGPRKFVVKFSGVDETADPPSRYFGLLAYSSADGGCWDSEWSSDPGGRLVTARVVYTLDPDTSTLTIYADSNDLERCPTVRQYRRSEWTDPAYDFVRVEARRVLEGLEWPPFRITIWDDAEERWAGEDE